VPETAKSWEVGLKADFLDRRLRTNLAVFHVDYNHFQGSQGTTQASSQQLATAILTPLYGAAITAQVVPALSTFVFDQGKIRAQGVELEVTAAPTRGVTFGGSVGLTDTKFPFVDPIVLASNGGAIRVTNRPKWTGTLWAAYESPPLADEMTFNLRADASYQSRMAIDVPVTRPAAFAPFAAARDAPAYWVVNGRASLRRIPLGGVDVEVAIWGKNLTNTRVQNFALIQALATGVNFIPARTYGVDLSVEF
jgi:iron complex outermembrane receptor protein